MIGLQATLVEDHYRNSGSWSIYLLPLKAENCPEEMTTEREREIKIARLLKRIFSSVIAN